MGRGGEFTSGASEFKKKHERMVQAGKIEDAGVKEVPFADGSKMTPMDLDQQTRFLIHTISKASMPGQGWLITNDAGEQQNVLFVKNDTVEAVYSHANYRLDTLGRARGELTGPPKDTGAQTPSDARAVKGAAKAMGWEVKTSVMSQPHTRHGKDFRQYLGRLAKAPNERKKISTRSNYYMDLALELRKDGLITIRARPTGEGFDAVIQPAGKTYLRNYAAVGIGPGGWFARIPRTGTPEHADYMTIVNARKQETKALNNRRKAVHWDHVKPTETEEGWTKPAPPPKPEPVPAAERPARPPRAERAPAAPGAEKKSDRALRLFRAHADENDAIPTRAEFMAVLQAAPFDMSKAGASTYYHNTKKKYAALNEKYSVLAALELMVELRDYEGDML